MCSDSGVEASFLAGGIPSDGIGGGGGAIGGIDDEPSSTLSETHEVMDHHRTTVKMYTLHIQFYKVRL